MTSPGICSGGSFTAIPVDLEDFDVPLHPQAQSFIDQIAAQDLPDWSEMTPQEGRKTFSSLTDLFGEPEPIHHVQDVVADQVPVRVYMPAAGGPFPVVVYFHGGGWVLGDLDTHDALCRRLANQAQCAVVSVGYRRAPEHKYPVPLNDCIAATHYVVDHARQLHVDPQRLSVAGDSAGGNLAAAVALMARDQGGPEIAFQLLIYPVLQPDFNTKSYLDCASGFGLTRETMIWFWQQYLAENADGQQAYAAPMRADDLRGLPPTHVITAEYDVLRDEGQAYADRLSRAGVPTTSHCYEGWIHGFTHFAGLFDAGRQSVDDSAAVLRNALQV